MLMETISLELTKDKLAKVEELLGYTPSPKPTKEDYAYSKGLYDMALALGIVNKDGFIIGENAID